VVVFFFQMKQIVVAHQFVGHEGAELDTSFAQQGQHVVILQFYEQKCNRTVHYKEQIVIVSDKKSEKLLHVRNSGFMISVRVFLFFSEQSLVSISGIKASDLPAAYFLLHFPHQTQQLSVQYVKRKKYDSKCKYNR